MSKVRCNFCKEYIDRDTAYRRGINSFCNADHAGQAMFKLRTKADGLKRRSGTGIERAIRLAVYERDKRVCVYCFTGWNVHLHHIAYRSEGGPDTADNLISLCQEHHEMVHSNKKKWQPLCFQYVYFKALGRDVTLKGLEQDGNT